MDFNAVSVAVRILLAAVMGGLIGGERGRHGRAAGLRTHILVCVGAAITSLTSLFLSENLGFTSDIARLSAQVISGIGFLGAGTIMVRNISVITGLTTAAGMWATAAIGISTGYGFYVGAVFATVLCIFSVTFLSRLEISQKEIVSMYMELSEISETNKIIDQVKDLDKSFASFDIVPPKSGNAGSVGLLFQISNEETFHIIKETICNNDNSVIIVCEINT